MGLEAGIVLHIEKQGEKIVLEPVQGEPQVVEKKGILVFAGGAVGDVSSALHHHRRSPLKKIGRIK